MGIAKGSYVFATKYNDGDPGDAWAVGFYIEQIDWGGQVRHLVGDKDGKLFYGPKGFVRVRANLDPNVGRWLVENAAILERSPPGTINMWAMLTDHAFGDEDDRSTGSGIVGAGEIAKTQG